VRRSQYEALHRQTLTDPARRAPANCRRFAVVRESGLKGSAQPMEMNGRRAFKLMIVDDSNIMRRRIERSQQFDELELIGTAGNGVEAIELFRKMDPDVVTMDLTMPQMDGIECISKLVELKPAVRILVISALADKATAVEAMERGANGFLNKPFTDRQLNEAIAELIRE
jgi:two-component system, chemotaxis family, chemotaxis protein CheY